MDNIDKLLIAIAIGAVALTFGLVGLGFYIIWKAVFGA